MNIEVSKLRLLPYKNLKAIVSVLVEGNLAIHDIKIIQMEGRTIVAMPSREDKQGVFRDVVHPITQDFREQINNVILTEYERQALLHNGEAPHII